MGEFSSYLLKRCQDTQEPFQTYKRSRFATYSSCSCSIPQGIYDLSSPSPVSHTRKDNRCRGSSWRWFLDPPQVHRGHTASHQTIGHYWRCPGSLKNDTTVTALLGGRRAVSPLMFDPLRVQTEHVLCQRRKKHLCLQLRKLQHYYLSVTTQFWTFATPRDLPTSRGEQTARYLAHTAIASAGSVRLADISVTLSARRCWPERGTRNARVLLPAQLTSISIIWMSFIAVFPRRAVGG